MRCVLASIFPDGVEISSAQLVEKLEKQKRTEWIEDEHAYLLDPEIYAFEPESAWKRLKVRKYRNDYLAVLANETGIVTLLPR